jgi:hypothetical protein
LLLLVRLAFLPHLCFRCVLHVLLLFAWRAFHTNTSVVLHVMLLFDMPCLQTSMQVVDAVGLCGIPFNISPSAACCTLLPDMPCLFVLRRWWMLLACLASHSTSAPLRSLEASSGAWRWRCSWCAGRLCCCWTSHLQDWTGTRAGGLLILCCQHVKSDILPIGVQRQVVVVCVLGHIGFPFNSKAVHVAA